VRAHSVVAPEQKLIWHEIRLPWCPLPCRYSASCCHHHC
jgi:hypothetical protein